MVKKNISDSAKRMAKLINHSGSAALEPRRCESYILNFSEKNFDAKKILSLYDKDSLFQQAIDTPVEDALSPWRDGVSYDAELNVKNIVIESIKQARLVREVALLPVMTDSEGNFIRFRESLDKAIEKGAKISHILMVDSFDASEQLESNIFSKNYKNPKSYFIDNGAEDPVEVDASRIVIVRGSRGNLSAAESFLYYFSMFHDVYEEMIRAAGESNIWMLGTDLQAIQDAMQDAFDVGLQEGSTEEALERRLENFRSSVSTSRGAYMYDKEMEELDRNPVTNLDAIKNALDKSLDVLCAAVDIVPSRFLGKSFGSLNSSNKADIVNMTMIACNFRSQYADPVLSDLDFIISSVEGSQVANYEWNPVKAEEIELRLNGGDDESLVTA